MSEVHPLQSGQTTDQESPEIVNLILRKVGSQYVLYSHKTHKRLGTFKSRAAAIRRERQINFFKHRGG